LRHALRQHAENPIAALVYVGDACEENVEELAGLASELGALKLLAFLFLEGEPGDDNDVEDAFRLIAAWFGIDWPQAVAQFAATLNAVAKLAVGDASAIAAITQRCDSILRALAGHGVLASRDTSRREGCRGKG
jgi:hypothetical protein